MMRYHENGRGFTLVEILIAIFIFAIVLSTIYSSYIGTFRIINETEYQADIYSMARITLERMHEDLESVYMRQHSGPTQSDEENGSASDFVGDDREISGRDADSLRFVSRAHVVFTEQDRVSGTAAIEYYIAENDEEEGFVLYRSDTPELTEAPSEATDGIVLCEKLQAINFIYYDANGEEYNNWDSTTEEFKDRIPNRVAISLEFANESDLEAPFKFRTAVVLPMAGEKPEEGS